MESTNSSAVNEKKEGSETTSKNKTDKSSTSKSSGKTVSKRNKLSASNIIAAQEQKKILESADIDIPLTKSGIMEINLLSGKEKGETDGEPKQKKKKHKKRGKSQKNREAKEKESYSSNSDKEETKPSKKSKKAKQAAEKSQNLLPKPPKEPTEPPMYNSPVQKLTGKRNMNRFSNDNLSLSISSDDPFKSIDTINSTDWHHLSNSSLRREDSEDFRSRDSATISEPEGTNENTPKRKRPRKIITKPTPERTSLLSLLKPAHHSQQQQVRPPSNDAVAKYPSPPKQAPPVRKSRSRLESDSCSTLSTDDPPKAEVRRSSENTINTEDSTTSLHEPRETPARRARRSPLRLNSNGQPATTQSGEFVSQDEIAVDAGSDSSDSDQSNRLSRSGTFFSESASSSEKARIKENRPPPLKIDNKPRSREARKINDELERRNQNTPRDNFVIKADLSFLQNNKQYSPPNWNITVHKLNEPNDAKYIHQMQTLFSMSSILNGLKKH